MMGYMWLNAMKTFSGKLYSVQIDPNEIPGIEELGVANYKSLADVPDEIDYVLCAVPRPVAARIVADCAAKKVGAVALFTSGFAETETEDGIEAQRKVTEIAREGDLLLIGPNCMGLYNRRLGVRHSGDQPAGDPGNVGVHRPERHAHDQLLAGRLGARDQVLEDGQLRQRRAAQRVGLPRLLRAGPGDRGHRHVHRGREGRPALPRARCKAAAKRKPVVVWKGGTTTAGGRAVYSHTASLATSPAIWDAAMRQAGVIQTDNLDETIDAVKALVHCKPTTGRGMGLVAMTGGQSVVITDAFEREGLDVPLLTDEVVREARRRSSTSSAAPTATRSTPAARSAWASCPATCRSSSTSWRRTRTSTPWRWRSAARSSPGGCARAPPSWTPSSTCSPSSGSSSAEAVPGDRAPFARRRRHGRDPRPLLERGVATFTSFQAAARAMCRAISYWRRRKGLD